MREQPAYIRLGIFVAALIGVGALLGLIGPIGTFTYLGTPQRFIYWISIVTLNGVQAHIIIYLFSRWLAPPTWSVPVPVVAGSVVCSLPGALEVLWLDIMLRENQETLSQGFAEVYLYVLIITVLLSFLFTLGPLRHFTFLPLIEVEPEENSTNEAPPAFLKRIPEELGRDLVCLEMEDHYVRVHTLIGNDLILMRLRDAVDELEGYDGEQVHRSYWIAKNAIVSDKRTGERALVTLKNGMEVPVSRTRLRDLRKQGFFEG